MPLEAEQAHRSGWDAFARGAEGWFAMQKNSGRFAHPVSRNRVEVEWYSKDSIMVLHLRCAGSGMPMRPTRTEPKM